MNEPWNVDLGRELQNQVHVVAHDAERDQSRAVAPGDLGKHAT
ncbi:MAG TPA: hypothetical protein VN964_15415 [Gemmatimonadales bacterium]|nr:hypothetical protein [Gemmatimonadales bacterium]